MQRTTLACLLALAAPLAAQETPAPPTALAGVVVTTTGEPIAGAVVEAAAGARRGREPPPPATATTDAGGRFRLEPLPPAARLVVRVRAPGRALGVRVIGGRAARREDPLALRFELEPGLAIEGTVVDDETGEGIEGAAVTFEQTARALTDARGAFRLDHLPASDARFPLAVSRRGFRPADAVVENSGEPVLRAKPIRLAKGASVRIAVRDADGRAVADAWVVARLLNAIPYSAADQTPVEGKTDAAGRAVVSGLEPGVPVACEVDAKGFPLHQTSVLVADVRGAEASVILSPGRALEVIARDEGDRPLAGVEVRIDPLVEPRLDTRGPAPEDEERLPRRRARTGSDGRVRFEDLPCGAVTVEARQAGRATQAALARLPETGEAVVRSFTLVADPEPPPSGMPWLPSVAEGYRQARERGTALFVSMAMDQEPANDAIAARHFHDPEIRRAAADLACLISSTFDHPDGEAGRCARYGAVRCEEHVAVEAWAVKTFIPRGTAFQVPQNIFVTPYGEVLFRRTYWLSERDLQWMLVRALRCTSPELAARRAAARLPDLARALAGPAGPASEAAAADLAFWANFGEESAVSLAGGLRGLGVPAETRLRVLRALIPSRLQVPRSALAGFVDDPDSAVAAAAKAALDALGPAAAAPVEEGPDVLPDEERARTVLAAGGVGAARLAMALGRSGARWAAPELRRLLADRSPMVCASAAAALGLLGDAESVPALQPLLEAGDDDVRASAAEALARLHAAGGAEALAVFRDHPRHGPSARRVLAEVGR